MHLKKNYFFLPGVGALKKKGGDEGGSWKPLSNYESNMAKSDKSNARKVSLY